MSSSPTRPLPEPGAAPSATPAATCTATDADPVSATAPALGEGASARRTSSQALMGDERELLIDHGDSTYRLRITSMGRLILTK